MDKDKSKTMMFRAQKGPISELNGCITCKLCKGYFIDATTIIECLHTFCRSCIVRYLESNKYCPICDVQVHKTKPLLNIRRDKTIQDLVYKLVPRLYQNESKRRKIFYEGRPEAKPSLSEENTASQYEYILAPDEAINLTLSYYGCSNAPRYLRCPSAVSILHLKKLIQAKYELTDHHKVDVFYNQEILNPSLSLMDVAYIYSWIKKEPLDLTYKIYECRAKKLKLDCTESGESGVNRSAHNNNNWKEVQLRISENGEMSITGIQDANMLELLDATEKFKSEIVINESKNMENFPKPATSSEEAGAREAPQSKPAEGSSTPVENHLPAKKELPELKFIGKAMSGSPSTLTNTKSIANTKLLNSGIKMVINNAKSGAKITGNPQLDVKKPTTISVESSTSVTCISKATLVKSRTSTPKSIELSETLNLNNELSVIPLNASVSCVSLSSCGGTTTVFSTISKSMCSTKSDDSYSSNPGMIERNDNNKATIHFEKQLPTNSISKESNKLKRKCDETEKTAEVPAKLPKPTILNHSIGLMNLSNNHPLKKHSKMNRNGERRIPELNDKMPVSSPSLTVSHVLVSQKPASQDNASSKPVIINKNLSYLQLNRSGTPKLSLSQKSSHSGNLPCYMPKMTLNSVASKNNEKNGERVEVSQEKSEGPVSTVLKPSVAHSHTHHPPIITPAQLPHHQNLNSLQLKQPAAVNSKEVVDKQEQENGKTPQNQASTTGDKLSAPLNQSNTQSSQKSCDNNAESLQPAVTRHSGQNQDGVVATSGTSTAQNSTTILNSSVSTTIKAKPSTPIGYKTLRDPPKSWNSQINSQIAKVNQNVKAQQLANAAAVAGGAGNAQGRYGGDLKSVRPAKFFKGRNMPRYLGNPASGVKPMYQVHVSPEKDKNQEQLAQNSKTEKSEIKKHSIVKIDPKTLKPISEKAPETSNLSNISTNLSASQNNQELRINSSTGDLKINTSSVPIFNPLKLQQNSPKNERKSPKSPHSPKVKATTNAAAATTNTSTNSSPSPINALSPKQQRDKTSLTFTPPNPFVPNLASPTLNPSQFLYPAGGFPSYDPRFMAACHSFWYTQRMAAAAAAGLVPPPLPHAFGLSIGLNSATTIGQQSHSPGVSPKHSNSAKSTGLPSPRTSSTTTALSKSSPTATNKKIKESTAAKSEKSLETALEKLTQNKAKELGASAETRAASVNKSVKNGSPVTKAPTSKKGSTVKNSEQNDTQLKKALSKDPADDGQDKSLENQKDGRNSPLNGNKAENRLTEGKQTVPEALPLTEQSSNSSDGNKSPNKDSEKAGINESFEVSSSPKAETPLAGDKEQKAEDDCGKQKENPSPEIQRRLGQPLSNSGEEEKASEPAQSASGEQDAPSKSAAAPGEAKTEQKQPSDTNSCENPTELTNNIASDADTTKDHHSDASKCDNPASGEQPVEGREATDGAAKEKPFSSVANGNTEATETGESANGKNEGKVCAEGDSGGGGGEKTNSV